MSRNLVPKFILILVLVVLAALALYPPGRTLKPGIDLAGGTSLIYAINTEGMSAQEQSGLAQKMIQVLRHRIDPANIQNLVWRPLGNTRFEIQMPMASKETQDKRDAFQAAMDDLLKKNISPAVIMRSLRLPPDQRSKEFEQFAQGNSNHLKILNDLAAAQDERQQLQQQRDTLSKEIQTLSEKLKAAGLDMSRIDANRMQWSKLDDAALTKSLTDLLGPKADPQNLASAQTYIRSYAKLAEAFDKLTAPGGANDKYEGSRKQLDKLNITQEGVTKVLETTSPSKRADEIAKFTTEHPDRAKEIERVAAAHDAYRPFQGRLDDPADLRRMLKGAGVLEFRILPTRGRPELSEAEIQRYTEDLASKGPKAASKPNQYLWVEIESLEEWQRLMNITITGQFGDKYYVLASDRLPDEALLHRSGAPEWKLDNSRPTSDEYGRRAIGFTLDLKGGDLFYRVTSKNQQRPLCIILDDKAISAPNINSPIHSSGIIQGSFTPTQVSDMVDKLNAGSLPGRLVEQPISERVIGPSIGADNVHRGIVSGLIGMFLVIGFMLIYYMIGGSIADVAMLLNLLFTLAIMALLRATFTLSGIASTILTIGMSVDANVLIFERIREEQEKGLGLATAIRNGYQRAFSAIFDSNLTTVLAAGILYYVGTEDLKGFAIVLILGLLSNLFTAVFVTRVILEYLVSKRIIKNHLMMLRLIHVPHINWMRLRPVFFTISGTLIIGGLTVFFLRDKSKYGIEFTGGTSVQIALKQGSSLTRQDAQDRMDQIGAKLNNPDLRSASVYSVGDPVGQAGSEKIYDQYEITTVATNKLQTAVTLAEGDPQTPEALTAAIRKAAAGTRAELGDLTVTPTGPRAFVLTNTYVNPPVVRSVLTKAFPNAVVAEPKVDEVVSDAILEAFGGQLALQQNLKPTITSAEKITDQIVETYPELAPYIGGVKIEATVENPASLREIDDRLKDLKFRPDTQELASYTYSLFGPGFKTLEPTQPAKAFTFVSMEPEAGLRELNEQEWVQFVENEKARVLQATERETSLPRVTRIDPFVTGEARSRALIAGVLAVLAMGAYVWFRWGDARYGFGAIVTLAHDTAVSIGLISVCTFLAATSIGQFLLIGDFKIDLVIIAAILTLIGYSINDTVVIYDRIRENRTRRGGRELLISAEIINDGINQTLSRTLITGCTTLMVLAVLYIFGGEGLRGFSFVMLTGIVVGTYSSVAISAPVLLLWRKYEQAAAARQTARQAELKKA